MNVEQSEKASESVIVDRDLFEWLVEYAIALRGEWHWKVDAHRKYDQEIGDLDRRIHEGVVIRDGVGSNTDNQRDAIIEECAVVAETREPGTRYCWINGSTFGSLALEIANQIRKLKSITT